ncbi:MAG TPA: nucleoside-diphosphate sugar epimerase/dehydratase [Solirubrobacteraceae bacterium]|jgi:FlaA1/EpsC-like NDP-sugar epimerase|nr:nucleoside-diphosphate sugar epimerase/dehydratase [Solirubrobacteraceae bacterium]
MRRRIRSAGLPVHRHSVPQVIVDGLLVAAAWLLAFQLRFDNGIPPRYRDLVSSTVAVVVAGSLLIFALSGMYQKWWRYLGREDYQGVLRSVALATVAVAAYIALAHPTQVQVGSRIVAIAAPAGVIALFFLLTVAFTCGVRLLVSEVLERPVRGFHAPRGARDVLIVGSGDGGRLVLRELVRNPGLGLRPVGFVDDDPRKRNLRLDHGLRVLGRTDELPRVLDEAEPDEVLIAIPSAPGTLRARVVRACRDRGIPVRTLPTVFELLQTGANVMRQVRELRVEDVLGREPVRIELERVGAYLTGQVVLVTGAGGSIGAELCRQIARVGPRRLVLVDHAEDNLFAIMRELEEDRHVRGAIPMLADCREEERMREVFAEHRPTAVFHAAAYKHVGLMEANPVEAVRNNALATRITAHVAGEHGVGTFVLVSTDKAVSPATVMGASKALAEWAVEAAGAHHPDTRYATVRFGNVLGSSGSVVTIFRRQIAAGGPVTVTDRRMTRYFMTIPEAVQLIIRSGSLGQGGEVFVLEMGEPVGIMDLARDMIRLSGLEPDRDIAIEVVGRRPGEKLHEELFNPFERPQPTGAEKILLAEREPLDPRWVDETFDQVNVLVLEGDAAGLAAKVAELSSARSGTALGTSS